MNDFVAIAFLSDFSAMEKPSSSTDFKRKERESDNIETPVKIIAVDDHTVLISADDLASSFDIKQDIKVDAENEHVEKLETSEIFTEEELKEEVPLCPYELCFVTETTGLPKKQNKHTPHYENLECWEPCRMLSIAWIIYNDDFETIESSHYIIKPDGFTISEESIAIHGITAEYANKHGVSIDTVFEKLSIALKLCNTIVTHALLFHLNVLKSELFRNSKLELLNELETKESICTMTLAKEKGLLKRNPNLNTLYFTIFKEQLPQPTRHKAAYDVIYILDCYRHLCSLTKNN